MTALLKTMLIAALGVAVFHTLNLPLPFLFGPMFACLGAALLGVQLKGNKLVEHGSRSILGVAVGASITPALLAQLPTMATTIALVPPYILLIGLIGVPFFRRFGGYDRPTAYYAAMPGGFQDMVLFGQEAGANTRALALIHATRVLMIVVLAPIILAFAYGVTLDGAIGAPAAEVPAHELALMAAAAIIGWQVAKKLGLFGAPILGPMIVTAALSLLDLLHFRPPSEAIQAAQYFIGLGIGVQYVGVTLRELRHDVAVGAAFAVILAALAAVFTVIARQLGGAPPVEAFLSFAPGGQAELAVLAIVVGADLGFIVAHHVVRLVMVISLAPLIGARFLRQSGD
ncbi:AbrB family transcriptional regulator [Rhodobacteraceae bacterium 2376]|uniref:AbrB family transcriptional regulator n=1 Tax=Rhabdonatronobacter sediminivivens TaxID=2743469 RepID=A0A7Z0HX49_9RHOB|nr:AbrB family transcriptional regulator [Rhabdonatronobacter sediminivivens]NYS23936.1 AbrB family transcriptional regulator [Rhabdonatronobacter sediminivivens]